MFGREPTPDPTWQEPFLVRVWECLLTNIPDSWKAAELELNVGSQETQTIGVVESIGHVIRSPEGYRDVVMPSDDLMLATRELQLASRQHAADWTTATIKVAWTEAKQNWNCSIDYEY